MRSMIYKYFLEMGIDVSWYSKKRTIEDSSGLKTLNSIDQLVKDCQKCDLYKTRKNTVCGDGDTNSDVMIIGEAPGKEEDQAGKPFIGRAGRLLNEFLKSIGLNRDSIYIVNTV